jgi:hypothetical protein
MDVMKNLTKTAIALALAATVGLGAGTVMARGPGDCGDESRGKGRTSMMKQMDPAKMGERMEKRLGDLQTALALKPGQAAAWDQFSLVVREKGKAAAEHMKTMRERERPATAVERMARMEAFGKERMAGMAEMRSATEAFYGQLDAAQQKTFDEQFRMFGPGNHDRGDHRHGQRGGGRMG